MDTAIRRIVARYARAAQPVPLKAAAEGTTA